ncbi:MAG TPA: zinc ribbon domain-containing protein [Ktedonobacteraceae bacterium]
MSQMSERHCPTCGISITADQRFCTNCGTVIDTQSPPPSQYGAQPPSQSYPYPQQTPPYAQQPQPYAQQQVPSYAQSSQQQVPPYAQQQQPQNQSPIAEAFGALGLLFLLRGFGGRKYAGYRPQRQRSSCCGCLVLLVVLFLCLGVPSLYYASKTSLSIFSKSLNYRNGSSNSSNSSNSGSVPNTQPQITTAPNNQTVTYAGVVITIVSVQQSTAFIDDSSTAANGMIRVNINEANNSGSDASYFYSDMARLILPDKSSVAPVNEKQPSPPANSNTRDNWLDFAVPTSNKIDQLTLLLGTTQEAQISIPLTGKADLSAFQTKMANPKIPISYGGLNWTLNTASSSLSIGGKQTTTGMRYVVLSFNVDNPTSGNVTITFTDEYMRLKSGDTTNPALSNTLTGTVNANTTGGGGTVTFLMPANATAFTLIFLAQHHLGDPPSDIQVNTDFTI